MITQTPWFERKFNFNFPVGLSPIIVERLRGTIPQLKAIVENISDERLSIKKDDKWSVKEIAGHLFDLEELWSKRIDDFLAQKETLSAADLSNTKTHQANHNSKTIAELINQFSAARNNLIKKIENIDETTALTVSVHPRLKQKMRLIDSLFFIAEHDDHELTKIRSLLMDKNL